MSALSERQADVFRGANDAVVATLRADGSPHTSVVWVDWDGERVVFNTTLTREKTRNIRRDPRVSVTVIDPSGPFRHVTVEGIAELDEDGADAHMDAMSRKYTGTEWRGAPGRVIVRVRPLRVHSYGIT